MALGVALLQQWVGKMNFGWRWRCGATNRPDYSFLFNLAHVRDFAESGVRILGKALQNPQKRGSMILNLRKRLWRLCDWSGL